MTRGAHWYVGRFAYFPVRVAVVPFLISFISAVRLRLGYLDYSIVGGKICSMLPSAECIFIHWYIGFYPCLAGLFLIVQDI